MGGGMGQGLFSIPSELPFADAFAAGLLDSVAGDISALPQMEIYLPNRRAVRALREAFLRLSLGKTVLLPRMIPIGDIADDDLLDPVSAESGLPASDLPPAIPPILRQLELTRLIMASQRNPIENVALAAGLAAELGRLIDQVIIEKRDFADLKDIIPEEFAEHWQITLDFLEDITHDWPAILEKNGYIEQAEKRNRAIESRIKAWQQSPPSNSVYAAGTTGTMPATADLIESVLELPEGAAVLPGLDTHLDDESFDAISETHPQFSMKMLLERLGVQRNDVKKWPISAAGKLRGQGRAERAILLSETMRPAETTGQWSAYKPDSAAMDGLSRATARTLNEEAQIIALKLREVLEIPDQTAALVTPDRRLARRVASELQRWNIDIDDSAGTPLAQTPPGSFIRLIAEAFAERLAPVDLLALLKHPLAACGLKPVQCRRLARKLETEVLRGPRPAPGLPGLRAAIDKAADLKEDEAWLSTFEKASRSFAGFFDVSGQSPAFQDILRAHLTLAEELASTDKQEGSARLWRGESGDAASRFFSELYAHAAALGPVKPGYWPALLQQLMRDIVVRPRFGGHPRLSILGPLEARLNRSDIVILGGLNEGSWPPDAQTDPWMSRPMREQFGLGQPERRIGLSAHDFVQAAAAPQLLLTRSDKVDGRPTVPSRWLLRLETVIGEHALTDKNLLGWQMSLDAASTKPVEPPAPRPPVDARPRQLSVTRIETWIRNPYAIFAREILKLKPLDDLDMAPGAAERGSYIHKAFEKFVREFPDQLPKRPADVLREIGEQVFADYLDRPTVRAFWWPRFEKMIDWFVEQERQRRKPGVTVRAEVPGLWNLPGTDFSIKGVADRVECLANGSIIIIDYKTGGVPRAKDIEAGFAPQLPLEAAMAMADGFKDLTATGIDGLAYWKFSGGDPAGEIRTINIDPGEAANDARAGLETLVRAFAKQTTPYLAHPRPSQRGYDEYDYLARVQEWAEDTSG